MFITRSSSSSTSCWTCLNLASRPFLCFSSNIWVSALPIATFLLKAFILSFVECRVSCIPFNSSSKLWTSSEYYMMVCCICILVIFSIVPSFSNLIPCFIWIPFSASSSGLYFNCTSSSINLTSCFYVNWLISLQNLLVWLSSNFVFSIFVNTWLSMKSLSFFSSASRSCLKLCCLCSSIMSRTFPSVTGPPFLLFTVYITETARSPFNPSNFSSMPESLKYSKSFLNVSCSFMAWANFFSYCSWNSSIFSTKLKMPISSNLWTTLSW